MCDVVEYVIVEFFLKKKKLCCNWNLLCLVSIHPIIIETWEFQDVFP